MTDTFLTCHQFGLIQVCWSTYVVEEAQRSLLAKEANHHLEAGIRSRFEAMKTFALGQYPRYSCSISSEKSNPTGIVLPDPKDIQVLDDAHQGQADIIVTNNLRDFPSELLAQLGIEALTPDAVLTDMYRTNATISNTAMDYLRARKQRPPWSKTHLLDRLRLNGCAQFAAELEGGWT